MRTRTAPTTALIGDVGGWVTDVIESLGYAGVAGLLALENVFPPIPSELILPLAGFLAGQGRFWLPAVILAAVVGSVAGSLVLYAAGIWLGETRVRRLLERHGGWLRLGGRDLDRGNAWFDRHGAAAVLLCQLVPGVRSFISVPAGMRRMPLGRFVCFTAAGRAVWNSALILLGWYLGQRWEAVSDYASTLQYVVLAGLAAGVVFFVIHRRRTAPRDPERR